MNSLSFELKLSNLIVRTQTTMMGEFGRIRTSPWPSNDRVKASSLFNKATHSNQTLLSINIELLTQGTLQATRLINLTKRRRGVINSLTLLSKSAQKVTYEQQSISSKSRVVLSCEKSPGGKFSSVLLLLLVYRAVGLWDSSGTHRYRYYSSGTHSIRYLMSHCDLLRHENICSSTLPSWQGTMSLIGFSTP